MNRTSVKPKIRLPQVFTIYHWVGASSVFSILLLLARIITTGRLSYIFLGWNLILAYVPLFISTWIKNHRQVPGKKMKLIVLVFLWIIFMPNSFYLLTDLFHLHNMDNGHPWFDLTLILSFAWTGIICGLVSIRQVEILLTKIKGKEISVLVICSVMWLNAFGIYIGRFLRFNSWDIFLYPFALLGQIADMIFNPYNYRYAWVMCFCFASFMIIVYYTIKKLGETMSNGQ